MRDLQDFEFAPEAVLRDTASSMQAHGTLDSAEWAPVWADAIKGGYTDAQVVAAVGDILWHLQKGEWWREQYPRLLAARPRE
jgi:hypothetical protein